MSVNIIKQGVFSFLTELTENNNRDWFEKNKIRFKNHEFEMKGFLSEVNSRLNQHDNIEKAKIFRIYRDLRFSRNKTPYKTHFGMTLHRQKPNLRGGYYIHIEPNNSFLGVGFWGPNPPDLFRIRKELEFNSIELRKIINEKNFKKKWGLLVGEEVKTSPKSGGSGSLFRRRGENEKSLFGSRSWPEAFCKSFRKSSFGGWSWIEASSFTNPLGKGRLEAGA